MLTLALQLCANGCFQLCFNGPVRIKVESSYYLVKPHNIGN